MNDSKLHWLVRVGMDTYDLDPDDIIDYLQGVVISNQSLCGLLGDVYDGEIFRIEVCYPDSVSYRLYKENKGDGK